MFSLISRHLADNGAQRAAHLKFVRHFGIHTAEFGNPLPAKSLLNIFRHAIGVAANINVNFSSLISATALRPVRAVCLRILFFLVAGPGQIDAGQYAFFHSAATPR